jgi:hypothetical protein
MSARWNRSTADSLPATTNGKPKASARALAHIIERSSKIQGPAAAAYVERLRRADPGADPAVIVLKLEKRYLAAVTASGAAVGSAAVLPGIGTLAALSAAAGETAVFLEATAFFALAMAAVYGVSAENRERRPRWCWQCWLATTASTPWPNCSVRVGEMALGCRRAWHRYRCLRCHS